ncbi:hypothetical protein HZF24_12705 [Sedimentibacter hydroxybenzoicus DSM 7310]|uniref:Uncharacterized protein n=1 Tax=Sedimentibacter hydroxybenzoicus DSM 7310 TaxID=1123245 RepID=A0A974BKJ3_SEDHY|nr:hypothetical protein [Sedimentibacter hydroxybenzoicus]NYB75000.1 hypothetical protein [Sedimentibacter hydroxybenzoicus DSM 7310]
MDKKQVGLIVFLFGISIFSLELFFINIMRSVAGALSPVSYLLFNVFPMNIGFFIPIILSCIGIFLMMYNKHK